MVEKKHINTHTHKNKTQINGVMNIEHAIKES